MPQPMIGAKIKFEKVDATALADAISDAVSKGLASAAVPGFGAGDGDGAQAAGGGPGLGSLVAAVTGGNLLAAATLGAVEDIAKRSSALSGVLEAILKVLEITLLPLIWIFEMFVMPMAVLFIQAMLPLLKGMKEGLTVVKEGVSDAISVVGDKIEETTGIDVGKAFEEAAAPGGMLEQFGKDLAEAGFQPSLLLADKIKEKISESLPSWDEVLTKQKEVNTGVGTFLSDTLKGFLELPGKIVNTIITGMGDFTTWVSDNIEPIVDDLTAEFTEFVEGFVETGEEKFEELKTLISDIVDEHIKPKWVELQEKIEEIMDAIIPSWDDIKNFFTVTIPGWFDSVTDWFSGLFSEEGDIHRWLGSISNMVGGFIDKVSGFLGGKPEPQQVGGEITRTGVYMLHAGERVMRPHEPGGTGTITVSPTFNVTINSDRDYDEIESRLMETIRNGLSLAGVST